MRGKVRNRVLSVLVVSSLIFGSGLVPQPTTLQASGYTESANQEEFQETNQDEIINSDLLSEGAEQGDDTDELSNVWVVNLSEGVSPEQIAGSVQAEILHNGPLNYLTLELPAERKDTAVKQLQQTAGVLSIHQAQKVKNAEVSVSAASIPAISDGYYSEQWSLSKAEVQKAWELGATGAGVTIAIIDTGVDVNHPDLKNNLVQGYNAITGRTGDTSVQDNNGHGTHVAGIAAAALNGDGVVGVAYQAKIMPIKAMDRSGEGVDYVVADGIVWAVDHGAQIVNLSLGGQTESKILQSAIEYAQENGVLVVAAAGNRDENSSGDTGKSITFPASEPGVLAVTATDKSDKVPSFSVTGPEAGLAAPGEEIISDYWQKRSGYATVTGTSMAAPFISGVAALVWGLHPELTAQQVKTILEDSALDLGTPGRDSNYGYGRVNAYWAVRFAGEAEKLASPANVSWAGGIVQTKVGETGQTSAFLAIPPRAFGMNQGKEALVELSTVQSVPADFPQEIIPAGEGISVEWNNLSQKNLSLSVNINSVDIAAIEGQMSGEQHLAYLYRWSGSRWIKIGGGVKPTELEAGQEVRAGISEPGIYRVGLERVPADSRIAGADRIQTAVQIAQANFPTGADTVLLARADDFPDALAGAPLAYKYHAPILLTEVAGLPGAVYEELLRLQPQKIILLGGTGAISANVEVRLKSLATVQRIGGANRYATAAGIAEELGMIGEAVVVNGNNYADAITMASIAAEYGIPILLSEKNTLPAETKEILRKYSVSKTEVIGGEGVVSDQVLKSLNTSVRLAGKDRYSTAAAVLMLFPPEGGIVYLATGENFPDALTGGVVAAMNNSRIVLVPTTGLSAVQETALIPWSGMSTMVLGGRAVVSDEVVSQVSALVQK